MECAGLDNHACELEATHRYRWPWGDEGTICDNHVPIYRTRAAQLGREIDIQALVRREYVTPNVKGLPKEVGELQMKLVSARDELRAKEAELRGKDTLIGELQGKIAQLTADAAAAAAAAAKK